MTTPALVTCATGKTGGHLVRQLVAAGHPVRAAVRDLERAAQDPRLAGAELVEFDFDRPETFGPAISGCGAAFAAVPFGRAMHDQGVALHEALGLSGVERIVRLSVLSAFIDDAIDLGRWHRDLDEDLFQHCEAPIFLRPEAFMQNLLGMAPAIKKGVLQAATGEGKTAYVAAEDVARVAVKALTEVDFKPGAYDLTGPEAYSLEGLAQLVSEVLGVPLRSETVSIRALEAKYKKIRTADWLMRSMVELAEATAADVGGRVTGIVERVTGEPPMHLADFLAEHRNVLLGQA